MSLDSRVISEAKGLSGLARTPTLPRACANFFEARLMSQEAYNRVMGPSDSMANWTAQVANYSFLSRLS